MEIPDILTSFQAGMNGLQNPSLLSRFFSLPGIGKVPQVYSFWKWGALILALVATFSGVITRIKLLVLRFCKDKFLLSSGPRWTQQLDEEDDEDRSCSSDSSENDEEDDEPTTSFQDRHPVDEVFSVAGSGRDLRQRRRRSGGDRHWWSELGSGKNVVKLWDSIGLWSEPEDESESVVSIWDLNKDQKVSSFSSRGCEIPAMSISSPAVIYSAGSNKRDNIFLGVFDTRVGGQTPAIHTQWRPLRGKVVGIGSGGVEKVYVMEDVGGASRVGDMRNVKRPLENLTESNGDTWWDADAVIIPNSFADESQ
ncbi:uncharacterized protein LOC127796527 [Diospyros lotus]|uniref:uncharacterized protein LOC127796527 n=1 Tax=Diospyros lotus TaxID=55363 RepID=UPI00225AB5BC|nr:uncharacterized protein LOC127796527 [Diospyros lotus]